MRNGKKLIYNLYFTKNKSTFAKILKIYKLKN